MAADVHRRGDGERIGAAELLRPARAPSAGTPAARRRTCCCRPRPGRSANATTAVTVLGVAKLRHAARPSGRCPAAFSSSAISTVTPHTITMTRHGIRLIASPSSAHAGEHQDHRAGERAHADVDLREDQHAQRCSDAITAERDPVCAVERCVGGSDASSVAAPRRALARTASGRRRGSSRRRRRARARPGCRDRSAISWPGRPIRAIRPLTMMPVGANGESDAGVGAVADHDRHQEQRDADARRRGHRHRREQRGGGDVAGPHRGERRAEHEEHDRDHAAVAAADRAPRGARAGRACRCTAPARTAASRRSSVRNS